MAVYLSKNSENRNMSCGKIEPDVHLIKQVEQETRPALEGPAVARTGPHRLPNRCSAKFGETAITSET
jgi:hypothetical protein